MANPKHAFGYSDRSGFRYPLKDLVPQYENGHDTGLLVGRDEVDIDHEQLQLSDVVTDDPTPLDNPRPDKEVVASRALSAWDPIGGGLTEMGSRTVGLNAKALAGKVTVT